MWSKSISKCHFTASKIAKIKILTPPKVGKNMEQLEFSFIVDGSGINYDHLETYLAVSHKDTRKPITNSMFRYFLKKNENMCSLKSTWIFRAVLFILVKNWKQLKCLLTRECINKLLYISTVEYHLSIERTKFMVNPKNLC